jgi:hypothetical protein
VMQRTQHCPRERRGIARRVTSRVDATGRVALATRCYVGRPLSPTCLRVR